MSRGHDHASRLRREPRVPHRRAAQLVHRRHASRLRPRRALDGLARGRRPQPGRRAGPLARLGRGATRQAQADEATHLRNAARDDPVRARQCDRAPGRDGRPRVGVDWATPIPGRGRGTHRGGGGRGRGRRQRGLGGVLSSRRKARYQPSLRVPAPRGRRRDLRSASWWRRSSSRKRDGRARSRGRPRGLRIDPRHHLVAPPPLAGARARRGAPRSRRGRESAPSSLPCRESRRSTTCTCGRWGRPKQRSPRTSWWPTRRRSIRAFCRTPRARSTKSSGSITRRCRSSTRRRRSRAAWRRKRSSEFLGGDASVAVGPKAQSAPPSAFISAIRIVVSLRGSSSESAPAAAAKADRRPRGSRRRPPAGTGGPTAACPRGARPRWPCSRSRRSSRPCRRRSTRGSGTSGPTS